MKTRFIENASPPNGKKGGKPLKYPFDLLRKANDKIIIACPIEAHPLVMSSANKYSIRHGFAVSCGRVGNTTEVFRLPPKQEAPE